MKITQEIKYKGIYLIVSGDYTESESQTYDYPGAPSSYEISKITLEDSEVDLFDLFTWNNLDEIGELVINKIEE